MLNLHHIVRPAINANYPDGDFELFRSTGQSNQNGIVTATYSPAIPIKGNFQSEGDAALAHADMAGQNTIIRRLYVYACDNRGKRPWSVYRPLARSGDYIRDIHGGYWLVTAVLEDFSDVGWECLRVTFQQTTTSINVVGGGVDECDCCHK